MLLTRRTLLAGLAALPGAARALPPAGSEKKVLVELFTSQGCDLCPEAGRAFAELAEAEQGRIVPIGFHVDYFNDPWRDPFSDKSYSQRQMAYNALYKGQKHPEYGLYYTPMLMIDGRSSVNGRDKAAARKAIRQALARPAPVELAIREAAAGEIELEAAPGGHPFPARELLLGLVITEDRAVTAVESGENRGKSLTDRHIARQFLHQFREAAGREGPISARFSLPAGLGGDPSGFRIAAFVQDPGTGRVLQAAAIPWRQRPVEGARNPAGGPEVPTPAGAK